MAQIGLLIYWISLLKIARHKIFLPIWNLPISDFPSESKHRPAAIKVKKLWGFRYFHDFTVLEIAKSRFMETLITQKVQKSAG